MCLLKMSGKGDETVAEWTDTATKERLTEIETEFNKLQKQGYFAADLKTNEIVDKFNPESDTLMIPRMQGGHRE